LSSTVTSPLARSGDFDPDYLCSRGQNGSGAGCPALIRNVVLVAHIRQRSFHLIIAGFSSLQVRSPCPDC
jgi:hypothetical protein